MNVGVLFDLDGVLIDSESLYTEFWNDIDKVYPTGIDNFAYVIKGNNLNRILNTYFPNKDIQNKIIDEINNFERKMTYNVFPGVTDFLSELKYRNIPTALVTSSDVKKMEKLYLQLPEFRSYFNAIVTGDMVKKSKPNPECFLLGASKIGLPASDCYVFEDSPSGIKAGLDCGAKVIALATTLHRPDINKDVNLIIDSFIDFNVDKMLDI